MSVIVWAGIGYVVALVLGLLLGLAVCRAAGDADRAQRAAARRRRR